MLGIFLTSVLVFPDCSQVLILDTDASDQGIGAVPQDDALEHVVSYVSRALNKAERRYSVTHKELLSVVTFLCHCWPYLLGRRFKLRILCFGLEILKNQRAK